MKIEISMRGLRGIGGTVNTLGYEKNYTYEKPPAIGDTANTLEYESTVVFQIKFPVL
jgi:hypothetical protein